MLSAKRLIYSLPLLILMMILSAGVVYAESDTAEEAERIMTSAGFGERSVSEAGCEDGYEAEYEAEEADAEDDADPAVESTAGEDAEDADPERSAAGSVPDNAEGRGAQEEPGNGKKTAARGRKPVTLIISCSVKGNLGDLSRRFEYSLALRGLEPETEYEIYEEYADLGSGFSGSGFVSNNDGQADLNFCLGDEDCLIIGELPAGTEFDICETANDHSPEYLVTEVKSGIRSGRGPSGSDLSTGEVQMNSPDTIYTVDFTNTRNLAPVTGTAHHEPSDETEQLITGFALIAILAVLYIRKRRSG